MVWNGYDDNKEMDISISKSNKTIWAKTIEKVLESKETNWYEIPDGIIASLVDPISGQISNNSKNQILYYLKGSEPTLTINNFNDLFLE